MLYLTEIRKGGNYVTGSVLFVSHTNSVDVKFTSDWRLKYPGFSLDVKSINCADRETFPLAWQHSTNWGDRFCNPHDVEISAGEVLEDFATESDIRWNYLNNAYERWLIDTDENQVVYIFFKFSCSTQSWQLSL